jgi:hypothetical protein
MMMRQYLLLLSFTAAAVAQVSTPAAGFVRDRMGSLRPVLGVSGSFVLGEAIEQGVISAGFGKKAGYAKTESELLVIRSGEVAERLSAPAGESVFYLGAGGEVEQIYFPAARELWRVQQPGFTKITDADQPHSSFEIREDELIVRDGTRIRLPESITDVEWLSENCVIIRGARALYAVRLGTNPQVTQLSQAAQ